MHCAGRPAAAAALAVAVLAVTACGGSGDRRAGAPGTHPHAAHPPASAASPTATPAAQAPPASPAPAVTTAGAPAGVAPTGVDPGSLPQTTTVPDKDAHFTQVMGLFWQAVTTGRTSAADQAFFPVGAYVQLKALDDDRYDWTHRLLAHFHLDIAAAHRLLGAGAPSAQLVAVEVGPARWIPPGGCYNRLGYWFSPESRVVYREGGAIHSFGIAALDGWRGEWYLVHLGTEHPPPGVGVVDDPRSGPGEPGDGGGC